MNFPDDLSMPLIPNSSSNDPYFKAEEDHYVGYYQPPTSDVPPFPQTCNSNTNPQNQGRYMESKMVIPTSYPDNNLFQLVNHGIDNPSQQQHMYAQHVGYAQQCQQQNGGLQLPNRTSHTSSGVINNFPVDLDYQNFPERLYKIQKRIRGKSEQRIEKNDLEFTLDFRDSVTLQLVRSVQIQVKRSKEVINVPKYVGPVQLEPKAMFNIEGTNKYQLKVDLDSIYEVNGKKVYQLQKTATEELNLFHLVINIKLGDSRFTSLETKEFLLVGKKTGTVATDLPRSVPPTPRFLPPRSDSFSSGGVSSPSSGYGTPGEEEDIFHASTIVAEHIKTKSIEIGDFFIGDTIQTHHGDIAYHFPLHDCDEIFKEGEVIGFILDKCENKMKIEKLTDEISDSVSLKGVITRSQYFEAMKPLNNVPTETVCMMGVVPVKVQGTVTSNEPLYASHDQPGIAVSGYSSNCKYIAKDSSLIGYAFQSFHPQSEDEIGFVQAGVSVLNSASHVLLNKRIRRLENHWERKIQNLTKTNARFKRCLGSSGVILTLLVVLLAIFLWQLLTPGSAYRYYQCRIGAISGHTATFSYVPGKYVFNVGNVNGIEFNFEDLMKKTDHGNYIDRKKGTRYFLNIDVCAYGGVRTTRDLTTSQKRVYGPDVFAVNANCTKAYYYTEWKSEWNKIVNSYMESPDVYVTKDVKPSCQSN